MHTTLNKNYIGNIDTVKKYNDKYIITGWVVPLITATSCSIGCEGFVSIKAQERQDVYKYYKEIHENYKRSGFILTVIPLTEELIIYVNQEPVFKVHVEIADNILQPNEICNTEFIVIDNFYKNIDKVRDYALRQDYINIETPYIGKRSTKTFMPAWFKGVIESYTKRPIKDFAPDSGVFGYCTSQDLISFNHSEYDYNAVIYLDPNSASCGGITTYKSKFTNLTHIATPADTILFKEPIEEINFKTFNNNNYYDNAYMEPINTIANIYNRLIIYNSRSLHMFTKHYGNKIDNSNLFQYFRFKNII